MIMVTRPHIKKPSQLFLYAYYAHTGFLSFSLWCIFVHQHMMRDCTLSNTHQLKNEKEDICCDGGLKKFGAMVAICIVSIDEMFDLFQSMPCHVDCT